MPNPNDNPDLKPPQIESATLTELLATKYFCVRVANRSPLAESLSVPAQPGPVQSARCSASGSAAPRLAVARPGELDDQLFAIVSRQASTLPAGPQMVTVTFRAGTPELAVLVAQAVADQLINESLTSQCDQVDAAVEFYAGQVKQAQAQLADADSKVDGYLAAHPEQRAQSAQSAVTHAMLARN